MTVKKFILLAVIVIVIIFVVTKFSVKKPISGNDFVETMKKYGFEVIDNAHIKDSDMLYESRFQSFEIERDPIEHYSAANLSRSTEFDYKIFPTEESAVKLFTLVENSKKLDVTRDQKVGNFNYQANSKNITNRGGDNYQRYYAQEYNNRYFLISRIENTILLGSIAEEDLDDTNKFLTEIGY